MAAFESSSILFIRVPLLFLLFLGCLSFGFAFSDDKATSLEIKKFFRNGDNVLHDWTDPPSSKYCAWRGVLCNATLSVVALNLSKLNLGGEISPAIGRLKSLRFFRPRKNHLSGQIPDEIGDCSSSRNLDPSFNELKGDIPFSFLKLKQLEYLFLKHNQLTGPISTLSQIPKLIFFNDGFVYCHGIGAPLGLNLASNLDYKMYWMLKEES